MKKGEIWIIDIPGLGGHEQRGRRPAIIKNNIMQWTPLEIVAIFFALIMLGVILFYPSTHSKNK